MRLTNAIFKIKDNKRDIFLEMITPLIDSSRQETGNIAYDLYASVENPNHFVMVEKWENLEDILNHNENAYLRALSAALPDMVTEAPNITFAEEI